MIPGPGPVNCQVRHKDDGTVRCETHGVEFTGPDIAAEVREHIEKAKEEWRQERDLFRELLRIFRRGRNMRTEEEVKGALEFWKKVPQSTTEPNPEQVLAKGIVWTLEWVLGREVGEIAAQAGDEEWIRRSTLSQS